MECCTCGCTDDQACPDGCFWAAENVCSQCEYVVRYAVVDPDYVLFRRRQRLRHVKFWTELVKRWRELQDHGRET